MSRILLDTNAYSHFLRGDRDVLLALSEADTVYLSVFAIGELYTGFRGGSKETHNKEYLKKFMAKPSVEILKGTVETAEIFSGIKYELKKIGKPIPLNDVWIAAHTLQTGSLLVTYDHHFHIVPGLRIWDKLKQER